MLYTPEDLEQINPNELLEEIWYNELLEVIN